tara:strand:+ start:110 stop:1642 length:1533 start_codon:yes stop_codon:yes gene_type:complete
MFPSNFNIPIDQSKLRAPSVPGGIPMSDMSREDLERVKAKSDYYQRKLRQPRIQRPVDYPRPIQNVPNLPPRLDQSALDSIRERIFGSPTSRDLGPLQFDISKIDPSKLMSPFDQSRLQDARRNYEDVVAAGGGGINPGGMFEGTPDLGGDDMILAGPDILETPPAGGGYDGGGINPVIGPNGERLLDMKEAGTGPFQPTQPNDATPTLGLDGKMYPSRDEAIAANANFGGGSAPTQPTPPTGEMPPAEAAPPAGTVPPPVTGDPNDPMSSLYGQIGVADEAGARDVIEKILAGESDQMTQDQRDLLSTGVYRRIANRLGIKDREGNLITPLSSVATGYDKTETPTGSQALRSLLDMEETEGGTGIEMLLNFLQGRMRPPNQGQMPPTGPFGTFPGGGSRYGMPQMPYMPQPPIFGGGFGGFGGYGGYGSPGMGGYMGMRPSLPYAGMSSPMFPSIFGMAPPSYYGGMPSMYGNYGGGFPIANRGQQSSNGMQGMGMSNPMPGAGGGVTN